MSHARPPEGARTAARQGEGTPAIISAAAGAARTPEVATKLPAVGPQCIAQLALLRRHTRPRLVMRYPKLFNHLACTRLGNTPCLPHRVL